MSYVTIVGGIIQPEFLDLPKSAEPIDTEWKDRLPITEEEAAAGGILRVVDTVRPDDTATTTTERTLELITSVPTVVWVQRPKTVDELERKATHDREVKLLASMTTLRSWAVTARAANVTSANAVATLGVVVKNLADFYDGFADLLDNIITKGQQ